MTHKEVWDNIDRVIKADRKRTEDFFADVTAYIKQFKAEAEEVEKITCPETKYKRTKELLAPFIDAGMITEDLKLTKNYGGEG
ncbi:MAG: hypothetical protein LBD85_05585 [Oscillospiraceae bacterium]|jgi:hypothetical protein|nr:hypothetical protein [Oscillospiraceae bacterium]